MPILHCPRLAFEAFNFDSHLLTVEQVMQDLKFLPLTQDAVEQKVAAFRTYTDEIRRSLPDVLLAMMTLLLNQYRAKYVLTHTVCIACQRIENTTTAAFRLFVQPAKFSGVISKLSLQAIDIYVPAGWMPSVHPAVSNTEWRMMIHNNMCSCAAVCVNKVNLISC